MSIGTTRRLNGPLIMGGPIHDCLSYRIHWECRQMTQPPMDRELLETFCKLACDSCMQANGPGLPQFSSAMTSSLQPSSSLHSTSEAAMSSSPQLPPSLHSTPETAETY